MGGFSNIGGSGGDVGGGAVLQRQLTTLTTAATITSTMSTTPTNTSGTEVLSRTIAPSYTSSKVRLQVMLTGATNNIDEGDANKYFFATLLRGTTVLAVWPIKMQQYAAETHHFTYTDSPATTSQQTYSVRVARNGTSSGNFLLNQFQNATAPTPPFISSLEAMEVS